MAPEFFVLTGCIFINWLFMNEFVNVLVIARLMIKNETAKTTSFHETIKQCYENDSKEMLNIYFFPLPI